MLVLAVVAGCAGNEGGPKGEGPDLGAELFGLDEDPFVQANAAIDANPNDAAAFCRRGDLHYQRERLDQALADYEGTLRLNPDAKTYYNRGVALGRRRPRPALADYNEVLRSSPTTRRTISRTARLTPVQQGRRGRSGPKADFTEAIRLAPKDASVALNRGLLYLAAAAWTRPSPTSTPPWPSIQPGRGADQPRLLRHSLGVTTRPSADLTRRSAWSAQPAQAYPTAATSYSQKGDTIRRWKT